MTSVRKIATSTNVDTVTNNQMKQLNFVTQDPELIRDILETQDLLSQELGMRVTRPQLLGYLIKYYLQEK